MPDHPGTSELDERRLRADGLRRVARECGPLPPSHEQTLHDLQESLEELRLAEEELRQQNEELVASWQELEHQRQRYRELFDFAPDGYIVSDGAGIIEEANHAAAALLGLPAEELVGKPLAVLVDRDDRRDLRAVINGLCAEQPSRRWEMRVHPRYAPSFWGMITVGAAFGPGNRPRRLRWVVRDISDRKQAEDDLRRQKEFAESLIETARAIVVVLDLDGAVSGCNRHLEHLLGLGSEEVKGRDWCRDFVAESDRARAREMFAPARSASRRFLCSVQTTQGLQRQIQWSSRLLENMSGEPVGVLGVGYDVTEWRDAQQRALHAERLAAIGQMVAGLAHESRNALQRGQACLSMLALRLKGQPDALDLIARLRNAQQHLYGLYEKVQGYARPIKLEYERANLGELLDETWNLLAPGGDVRRTNLGQASEVPSLACEVDRLSIGQVFRNILENSLAAQEGPLEIVAAWSEAVLPSGAALRLSLSDNGPGLAAAARQKIFEPFFTTKTQGTGLGMAIAKRIVEAHQGTIEVGAAEPGAEIVVTLPRRRP